MRLSLQRPGFPTCAAVQRSGGRGFTLLELLTVVTIIAIFAALALPTVVGRLKERRSANVAQQFVQAYRMARMRALGRGSAVLVRYNKTGNEVFVREAVAGAVGLYRCQMAPISSCNDRPLRFTTVGEYIELDRFNPFLTTGTGEYTKVQFTDAAQAVQASYDICYTPSGTAWWRIGDTTFSRSESVQSIDVWSEQDGVKIGPPRTVFLLPNGMARLGT